MAANNLSIEESYAFMNDLYEQATGQTASITAVDTESFITVAQAVLKTGYDNIINSISQVLGRTIFSVRPYSARFKGIEVDAQRWGAITRKINFIDQEAETDQRMSLTDGSSVDQYVVKKPAVLETNFYGSHEYQFHITIFKDQLDNAFQNETQFGSFLSGVMQNMADVIEQYKEAEKRATLINFITGKMAAGADCINVLQEYYNETGVTLTPTTMFNATNYVSFTKWLYSYINDLTDAMAERSEKFHINVTGKEIKRHSAPADLKAYMASKVLNKIDSAVMSTVFSPEKLKMIDFEKVVFWQNIEDPLAVSAYPTYLNAADGTLIVVDPDKSPTPDSPIEIDNLLGVIFDKDALGVTVESTWQMSTPFNAAGGYTNTFWHFRQRTWNDFTENGVILYADTVTT